MQILSLILMQAGVLPLTLNDLVLETFPVGGPGCCGSEKRDAHQLAFNQALEEYKKRNTPHVPFYPVILKATGDETTPVYFKFRADKHITTCAVKYQPADWLTVMTSTRSLVWAARSTRCTSK